MSTEANLEIIRRMWTAYETDGLLAITAFAHPDAHWHPHSAGGRRFLSTQEYRDYILESVAGNVHVEATLLGSWAHEDIVAVRGRIRVRRGGTVADDTRIYWVHRFRDEQIVWTGSSPDLGSLLEQAGHPDDRLASAASIALARGAG